MRSGLSIDRGSLVVFPGIAAGIEVFVSGNPVRVQGHDSPIHGNLFRYSLAGVDNRNSLAGKLFYKWAEERVMGTSQNHSVDSMSSKRFR